MIVLKKLNNKIKTQSKQWTLVLSAVFLLVTTQFLYAQQDDLGEKSSSVEVSETLEEQEENPTPIELTAEQKAQLKKQQQEAKLAAKEKARQKTDKYLGTVYVPQKKYELSKGNIKLSFRAGTGTFSLYAFDSQKKQIPLFNQYSDSISTSFFAKVGGTVYRLNKDAAVKKELRKTSSGAQLVYTITGKAQIAVDFEVISSILGKKEDMVKITVYSTNLLGDPQEISVKAVVDTILGEGTDFHFISTAGLKIASERQLLSVKKDRSIISTDGKSSFQVLLDGKSVSTPEQVSFAGVRSLLEGPWVPVIVEGRSFNSAVSYNNSALSVNWAGKKLKTGETSSVVFYFASGVDGAMPNGLSFVDYVLENEKTDKDIADEKTLEDSEQKKIETGEIKKPDIDFIIPPLTQEQLDPVYVQNLINRINALQSDPALVDRSEIRLLNAELDLIMEKIRRQN